jgi:putative two-component system response regulator
MKNFIQFIAKFLNPPRKTILVIDDSNVDRTFVEKILARRYNVIAVSDGRSGLEAVQRQKPDLILLDYMMPQMSGPEVCRQLKNDQATQDIPVIFLTGMDDAMAMSDGFEEGADHYLTKPIATQNLLDQVKLRLCLPVYR